MQSRRQGGNRHDLVHLPRLHRCWPTAKPLGQRLTHACTACLHLNPVQHGELRPGEVQDLLAKAKADLKAADAAAVAKESA